LTEGQGGRTLASAALTPHEEATLAKTTKPAAGATAAKKPASATKPAKPATRKPAAAPAAKAATKAKDPLRTELAAIQRKAKALSPSLTAASLDKDGNPTGAWAEMVAELEAWAKKYKVKLREVERDSGGGDPDDGRTPRTMGMCLGTHSSTERIDFVGGSHITVTTTCTFKRRTILTGRCVYKCVADIVGMHIV
jgi:hypothetical protein